MKEAIRAGEMAMTGERIDMAVNSKHDVINAMVLDEFTLKKNVIDVGIIKRKHRLIIEQAVHAMAEAVKYPSRRVATALAEAISSVAIQSIQISFTQNIAILCSTRNYPVEIWRACFVSSSRCWFFCLCCYFLCIINVKDMEPWLIITDYCSGFTNNGKAFFYASTMRKCEYYLLESLHSLLFSSNRSNVSYLWRIIPKQETFDLLDRNKLIIK